MTIKRQVPKFTITIPAMREEELISLYKQIYKTKDKRKKQIENEFEKRRISIEKVFQQFEDEKQNKLSKAYESKQQSNK